MKLSSVRPANHERTLSAPYCVQATGFFTTGGYHYTLSYAPVLRGVHMSFFWHSACGLPSFLCDLRGPLRSQIAHAWRAALLWTAYRMESAAPKDGGP